MYKNQDGFTLIELIIVIAILAILVAVAIPNIVESIDDSRKATDVASGKIIADAAARVLALEGKYSGFEETGLNINDLTENYVEGSPYDDDFQAELLNQLNDFRAQPKYKHVSVTADNFIVQVESGRLIRVYIGTGTDTSTGNALLIYPTPDSAYTD